MVIRTLENLSNALLLSDDINSSTVHLTSSKTFTRICRMSHFASHSQSSFMYGLRDDCVWYIIECRHSYLRMNMQENLWPHQNTSLICCWMSCVKFKSLNEWDHGKNSIVMKFKGSHLVSLHRRLELTMNHTVAGSGLIVYRMIVVCLYFILQQQLLDH